MSKESYHKAYIPDLHVQRFEEVLDAVQTFPGCISACSRSIIIQDETNKENFETNKMERKEISKFVELTVKKEKVKLDFSCREIMKEVKSLTYIIDNDLLQCS